MPDEPAPAQPVFPTPEAALASLGPLRERIAAVADKTPSTVVEAFNPTPTAGGLIVLPPLDMRVWLRLEKIKSPFLRGDAQEISMEEIMRSFYVIAMPHAEVGAAIAGGEGKLAAAVEEFSSLVPLNALPTLSQVIAAHLAKEFEPKGDFVRNEEGSGTGPKARASSATGPGLS